ncbi:MAG: nuclear transport factor 2 family protein [Actinomycetota bacterium]|nr:nuclear transport factor 2 family protein [Actinomycetota bacterium]
MPPSNVEILEALLPDRAVDLAALLRDDAAWEALAEGLRDVTDPEFEAAAPWGTYSGVDGFRAMWLDWLEPWESYHVQVEETVERGDSVVVLVRDRGRRHDTDAEVELISGSVWTFRDGRIAAIRFYPNREELREGLAG